MKRVTLALFAIIFSLVFFTACSRSQISLADYERVVSERDALQQQLNNLQSSQGASNNGQTSNAESAPDAESPSQVSDPESSQNDSQQSKEQVLVDQSGIKITYTGIESDYMGPEIKLKIENNSNVSITVQQRDMSINGAMIDGIFSCDVMPGKIANDSISIFESDLEDNGITSLENVELSFHIYADDTHEVILDTSPISFQTT